ncbi:Uncharacterized protein APZ42_007142, partial [Daphnia magna]
PSTQSNSKKKKKKNRKQMTWNDLAMMSSPRGAEVGAVCRSHTFDPDYFPIVKGRQQVKTAWFACVECQKLTSPPFQELAAPLPLNRLRQAQAFHITGVDFAGHLFYKPAPSRRKAKALTSVQHSTSTDDPNKEPAEELLAEEDAPNEAPLAGEETPTE